MAFYGQTQRESPNNKIIGGTINFNNNISKTNRKYSNNYNFNNKTPVYMNIENNNNNNFEGFYSLNKSPISYNENQKKNYFYFLEPDYLYSFSIEREYNFMGN